jgi:hypothetical protein
MEECNAKDKGKVQVFDNASGARNDNGHPNLGVEDENGWHALEVVLFYPRLDLGQMCNRGDGKDTAVGTVDVATGRVVHLREAVFLLAVLAVVGTHAHAKVLAVCL